MDKMVVANVFGFAAAGIGAVMFLPQVLKRYFFFNLFSFGNRFHFLGDLRNNDKSTAHSFC